MRPQLNISFNSIGGYYENGNIIPTPEGPKAIADALLVNTSLTKISLASNPLKEEGTKVICDALKSNSTLKELDLNGSGYTSGIIGGSAGAKHVADMLGVNTSLTNLS